MANYPVDFPHNLTNETLTDLFDQLLEDTLSDQPSEPEGVSLLVSATGMAPDGKPLPELLRSQAF